MRRQTLSNNKEGGAGSKVGTGKVSTNNRDIIIFIDHRPLISIFGKNSPKGVIGRWVLAIQEYNARLRYLPGKENTTADMLSRVPTEEILQDSVEWYIGESDELEESIFLMGNEREGKEKTIPDLEKI